MPRRWPAAPARPAATPDAATSPGQPRFSGADLDAVLAHYNQVVDRDGHVVGIVTQADFMRGAAYASGLDGLGERLRKLVTPSPVIAERNKLVGMITQTDLLAALARPS